jgi:ribosomal protein S15P/S13E
VTWRATNLALINNNQDPKSNRGILLKVITTTKDPDGKLAMVAVEFENMIATIHEVKDSILVAALVEVKPIMENLPGNVSNNNTAEIANMSGSNNNNNTAPSSNGQTPPDTTTHEHEAQEPPTTPAPASNKANDEEEETPSSPPTPTPTPSRPKPSQLQILTWRVEAMAEALREDLQDFKMPQGTF